MKQYYRTLISDAAGVDGQCHMNNLSGSLYFQYKELVGGHNIFANGYSSILEHFTEKIQTCRIILNSTVDLISWNNGGTDVRYRSDGATSTLKADIVVVTLPLGYLKLNCERLFSPPLPERKVVAIKK